MAKCVIIGAGDFSPLFLQIQKGDYVIAADGGYEYCKAAGIIPHLWIGDMDSTKEVVVEHEGMELLRLPSMKDDTDTLAAIRIGLQRGYREFALHGMLGGRLDHTMANICCLEFLKKQGCNGILYGKDTILTLLHNERICFDERMQGTISAFAWRRDAYGVTEENLLYEVQNTVFTTEFPIGVSNQFIGKNAIIEVTDGALLVCVIPKNIYDRNLKWTIGDRIWLIN